jgi:hypothetical protein
VRWVVIRGCLRPWLVDVVTSIGKAGLVWKFQTAAAVRWLSAAPSPHASSAASHHPSRRSATWPAA